MGKLTDKAIEELILVYGFRSAVVYLMRHCGYTEPQAIKKVQRIHDQIPGAKSP